MTFTLSPEALDLVQRGRQSLLADGPSGHTGQCYWSDDGTKRCAWGHMIKARAPGHDLDESDVVGAIRRSAIGNEIDEAYEDMFNHSIDHASEQGFRYAVEELDEFLLAVTPDWTPSTMQGSQHEVTP